MELRKEELLYRGEVENYLMRRHITETMSTLVWLRTQKTQSLDTKALALEKVEMEVGVLDAMIDETGVEE